MHFFQIMVLENSQNFYTFEMLSYPGFLDILFLLEIFYLLLYIFRSESKAMMYYTITQCLTGVYDRSKKNLGARYPRCAAFNSQHRQLNRTELATVFLALSYTTYVSGCSRFTPFLSLLAKKTPPF